MKRSIYWFSGTGNSLATAKVLRESLPEARLHAITGDGWTPDARCDHLILVFPVYALGLPGIVARFIAHLPDAPAPRASVVVTHGGAPGLAAGTAATLLADKGVRSVSVYNVKMVDNFPPFGGPPGAEKCRRLVESGTRRIAELARKMDTDDDLRRRHFIVSRFIGRTVNTLFHRLFRNCDRSFHATKNCTGCRICERICPVADIVMVDGRPKWLGRCELCFACYHWCPTGAILFGHRRKQPRQYRHPEINIEELLDRCTGKAPDEPGH